jgi:hypothetical protein
MSDENQKEVVMVYPLLKVIFSYPLEFPVFISVRDH